MATPLATAYVQLVASGTGLPASINQAVNQAVATAGPARVPVTPQITGPVTWQQIAGGAAVPVPVTPTIPPGVTQAAGARAGQQLGQAAQGTFLSNLFGGPGGRGRFGTQFSREVQAGAQSLGGVGQRLSQQLAFFGPTGLAVGAATLGVVASAKAFANFETELRTFNVVSKATNEQIEEASKLSKQLGADARLPGVSAADAAQAMTELTKAGIDINNTFAATPGVLELATAAQIDNAAAAELTASALNSFKLGGDQATHVADTLAGAALAAQGDIADMALGLRQSAAVARLAGFSFDETVTSLTVLARAGIAGSDAGTSLRTALLRLINPTTQAQKVLNELGVEIRDANGQITPGAFERLRGALDKLEPATRQTALAMIFGADAIRSASFLTEESAAQFDALEKQVTRAGQAAEITDARAGGLGGSFRNLANQAENLAINFGAITAPALGGAADFGASLLGGIGAAVDELGKNPVGRALIFGGPIRLGADLFHALRSGGDDAAQTVEDLTSRLTELQVVMLSFDALTGQQVVPTEELAKLRDDTIAEINKATSERKQVVTISGVELIPDVDTAKVEKLRSVLRSVLDTLQPLSPAFKQTAIDAKGFTTDLADAASRDNLITGNVSDIVFDARDAGIRVGEGFGKGVGDGIKNAEDETVTKAKESLRRVTREANQAVFDAVEAAKANLFSLGSSLGDQIGEIIDTQGIGQQATQLQNALDARRNRGTRLGLVQDLEEAKRAMAEAKLDAGPLANQIKGLQDQLDRLGRRDERADLLSSQRDAQDELARAKRAIDTGNLPVTGEMQRSIDEFLRPFQDRARQASSALKRNDLQGQIDTLTDKLDSQKRRLQGDPFASYRRSIARAKQAIEDFDQEQIIAGLQKQAQAQKDTVTRGVQDIIAEFNRGGITMAQANQRIANLIKSKVGPWQEAGKALGEAFNLKFIATVEGIQQQLEEIVLGPQRPGTTGARANVVKPRETLLQSIERKQDARDALNKAIAKSGENTDKGINGTGGVKQLLVQIRNELAPSGKYVQQGNK